MLLEMTKANRVFEKPSSAVVETDSLLKTIPF